MQKLQQIFITILIIFVATGTGKLIARIGNLNIGSIKTEVTASTTDTAVPSSDATNAPAVSTTPTPTAPETTSAEGTTIISSASTSETTLIQSAPVSAPTVTESAPVVSTESAPLTIDIEKDENEKEDQKKKLTVKEKREARLEAEKNKKKSEVASEKTSSDESKTEVAADESSPPETDKEETKTPTQIATPAPVSAPAPTPTPAPITPKLENTKKINIKNTPKLNKKILETIQAMRTIPNLFVQMGIIKSDTEKGEKKRQQNSLEIFTELIEMLTSNVQDNTLALEEVINDLYEAQGTQISHGRCITATYFTYSDTENTCLMISRKVCKTKDIIPDNRYDTIESCKADHGLLEKISESRETIAFKKQKEEYLEKLTTLQIAYKYYSVRWEELVDLVQDANDFDALSTAGNALNLYRTQQGEAEKSAPETTSTQDSTQLVPLSAASIQ